METLLDKVREKVKKDFEGIYRRDGKTPYYSHIARVEDISNFILINKFNKRQYKYIHRTVLAIVAQAHDLEEDIQKYSGNLFGLIDELKELDKEKELQNHHWSEIRESLASLNKNRYPDYYEYILGVANSTIYARIVKRADLTHNLETSTGNQRIKYLLSRNTLEIKQELEESNREISILNGYDQDG